MSEWPELQQGIKHDYNTRVDRGGGSHVNIELPVQCLSGLNYYKGIKPDYNTRVA